MAYTKTVWENGITPVNETIMNNIEQGVYTNSINAGELSNLNTTNKNNLVGAINEIKGLIQTASGHLEIGNIGVCWGNESITFGASTYSSKQVAFPFTFANTDYIVLECAGSNYGYYTEIYYAPNNKATTSCLVGGYNKMNTNVSGNVDYLIIGTLAS